MRTLWIVALLAAFTTPFLASPVLAQTDSSQGLIAPLDLPSGAAVNSETEEDEIETINFYGSNFEGDGFFWTLDRSGSMIGTPLSVLKTEVTSAIDQLSNRADIGMVQFDDNFQKWRSFPVESSQSAKAEARQWVNNLAGGGATCIAQAVIGTLEIANQSRKRNVQIILVGDGQPVCTENTVADITSANFKQLTINTLFIGSGSGAGLFQAIASSNNGTFTQAGG